MIRVAQFIEQVQPSLCCTYDLDNMYIVCLLYFFKIILFYLKIMSHGPLPSKL